MIRRNILANIVGRAWGIASVYLFVPLYLKFLGIEAYGLIGFYSTLVAVLAFADMGFTATLNREMARLSVSKDSATEMADLLRTYEALYLCISAAVASAVWMLSPFIAQHWLHSTVLQPREVTTAIRYMGVAIAFQLPAGLYTGGLMGLQRQVLSTSLQIIWGASRGVGAVLVLWLLSPTIVAFALWQLISTALCCLLIRWSLWRVVSQMSAETQPHFSLPALRNTWRYAIGMAGMSVFSILLTQADKVAVSKMLPLEMLGYYTLASAVASVPLAMAGPIVLAIFPRLTGLVAIGDLCQLKRIYHRACELVAVVAISGGMVLAMYSEELLRAWTGSTVTAHRAALAASLLVGGQLIQVITIVPYYLALANGNVRLNLKVGMISVAFVIPLLLVLVTRYGIVGAGASWLIMNICVMLPYMYLLHRRFLPGEFHIWIWRDTVMPLMAAVVALAACRWLIPVPSSRLLTFGLIAVAWSVSAVAASCVSADLRAVWKMDWVLNLKRFVYSAS